MNAEKNIADILNALSNEINQLYGYVTIPGDNFVSQPLIQAHAAHLLIPFASC